MVAAERRQEFRVRLQKRARRRAERRAENLDDEKSWKEVYRKANCSFYLAYNSRRFTKLIIKYIYYNSL